MNEYTTLNDARGYLSLASQNTSDDTQILEFIRSATREIKRACGRDFVPIARLQYYDIPDDDELEVNGDLLESLGLSHLNGASEVDSSVYWLRTGEDWNIWPKDRIVLDDTSGSSFNYSGTPRRAVHLLGLWGYREDYDTDGWVDSMTTLASSAGSIITALSLIGSSGGSNALGNTPRLQPQMLIRLGSGASQEIAYILSVTGSSLINVIRGANGTTAASHAASIGIHTWSVEPDIEYCAKRLTAWQYHQARSPFTGELRALGMGVIEMPSTWPMDVKQRLQHYRKRELRSSGW